MGPLAATSWQAQMFKAAERQNGVGRVRLGFGVVMASSVKLQDMHDAVATPMKQLWDQIEPIRLSAGLMVANTPAVMLEEALDSAHRLSKVPLVLDIPGAPDDVAGTWLKFQNTTCIDMLQFQMDMRRGVVVRAAAAETV